MNMKIQSTDLQSIKTTSIDDHKGVFNIGSLNIDLIAKVSVVFLALNMIKDKAYSHTKPIMASVTALSGVGALVSTHFIGIATLTFIGGWHLITMLGDESKLSSVVRSLKDSINLLKTNKKIDTENEENYKTINNKLTRIEKYITRIEELVSNEDEDEIEEISKKFEQITENTALIKEKVSDALELTKEIKGFLKDCENDVEKSSVSYKKVNNHFLNLSQKILIEKKKLDETPSDESGFLYKLAKSLDDLKEIQTALSESSASIREGFQNISKIKEIQERLSILNNEIDEGQNDILENIIQTIFKIEHRPKKNKEKIKLKIEDIKKENKEINEKVKSANSNIKDQIYYLTQVEENLESSQKSIQIFNITIGVLIGLVIGATTLEIGGTYILAIGISLAAITTYQYGGALAQKVTDFVLGSPKAQFKESMKLDSKDPIGYGFNNRASGIWGFISKITSKNDGEVKIFMTDSESLSYKFNLENKNPISISDVTGMITKLETSLMKGDGIKPDQGLKIIDQLKTGVSNKSFVSIPLLKHFKTLCKKLKKSSEEKKEVFFEESNKIKKKKDKKVTLKPKKIKTKVALTMKPTKNMAQQKAADLTIAT